MTKMYGDYIDSELRKRGYRLKHMFNFDDGDSIHMGYTHPWRNPIWYVTDIFTFDTPIEYQMQYGDHISDIISENTVKKGIFKIKLSYCEKQEKKNAEERAKNTLS